MLYTVTHAWAAAQSSGIDYSGAAPDWNTIAVQERILWRRRANITAAELPRFTPRGFQSMRTPPHIHAKLLQLYNEKKHFRVREVRREVASPGGESARANQRKYMCLTWYRLVRHVVGGAGLLEI